MSDRPRLSRDVASALTFAHDSTVAVPTEAMLALPERVVQFGTGAFLRGFIESFIDSANQRGDFGGTVVAIASTQSSRDGTLNDQDGLYTLATQGMLNGATRQEYRVIASLSRALSARADWDDVLELARDPNLRLIVSNTTEVGIVHDATDRFNGQPPRSFPGKLARFLFERAAHFEYANDAGLIVLPCELIEGNGDTLRDIVRTLAQRWAVDGRFVPWLDASVTFCNTLVDRIVPGPPAADEHDRIERLVGYRDGLMTVCEPYALFAIEGDDALRARLGFAGDDERIVVTADISPYRERKVRILNGGHTIMVPAALLAGLETVREAVTDVRLGRYLRRVLFEEIVPSLDAPDGERFAQEVLERFSNPYIRHSLIDITLHGTAKMRVRVVPSIVRYAERFGRVPASLAFGFAAYLAFMRGQVHAERSELGLATPADTEGEPLRTAWLSADVSSDAAILAFAHHACADTTLWRTDLSAIDGFAALVGEHLVRITRAGVRPALDVHFTEPVSTIS